MINFVIVVRGVKTNLVAFITNIEGLGIDHAMKSYNWSSLIFNKTGLFIKNVQPVKIDNDSYVLNQNDETLFTIEYNLSFFQSDKAQLNK